ncbi:MAG: 50S ribosome-binding GTPase [Planctomycetales bacterium]|nr:50S ribosome-binding GTPase [Planctomycetales bacterium]
MPANLTPQYHKAEAAYRQAETPQEELDCLQVMLREMPKHKGTDKLQADLKSKIAKAKAETQRPQPSATKAAASKIPKQGAGRIVLLGAPNSGKSQLLAALTRAQPEVAPYPFTTQAPLPGMMLFEDCPFQLIDLPPITADFFSSTTLGLVRGADLALLTIDLGNDDLVEETQAVLDQFNSGKTRLGRETALDEEDIGVSYTQTLVLLNKMDAPEARGRLALLDEFLPLPFDRLEVSGSEGTGLDDLRRQVFERLQIVRVYTKHPKEKEPDKSKPFTIRQGETLVEVAENVHRDMAANLKGARVWGASVHAGTTVKPDYQPQDGDIVELHSV